MATWSRRNAAGQYVQGENCDACNRKMAKAVSQGDYVTDDEVCGSSDGPGFYVCHACNDKLQGRSIEERRAVYAANCLR